MDEKEIALRSDCSRRLLELSKMAAVNSIALARIAYGLYRGAPLTKANGRLRTYAGTPENARTVEVAEVVDKSKASSVPIQETGRTPTSAEHGE